MPMLPIDRHPIHCLWDRLADFPAADTDGARVCLMKTVSGWIGADNAVWVGSVRLKCGAEAQSDPLQGWRAAASIPWRPLDADYRKLSRSFIRGQDSAPAMTSVAIARTAGQFRVHRMRDGFVDFAKFRRTAHYKQAYEARGIGDRIWVGFPVGTEAESFFLFDKRGRRRFSETEAETAGQALRGIKWFHRQLLLSQGLVMVRKPLSPVQRRVLRHLLTDKSEKEISGLLGQSFDTTHAHIMEIYQRFGVNGRAGLMSIWLGNIRPGGEALANQISTN